MGKFKDLTGMKFGCLTVIELSDKLGKQNRRYWKCRCSCGAECTVSSHNLVVGDTKSCGCLYNRRGEKQITHGMSKSPIYRIWRAMKERCNNPCNKSYKNYGGRGITVCDEWAASFQAFFDYVSKLEHYNEGGYSLDRINNNGNYEPGNLRFADNEDVAKKSEIKRGTLSGRLKRGDRGKRLFRPVGAK